MPVTLPRVKYPGMRKPLFFFFFSLLVVFAILSTDLRWGGHGLEYIHRVYIR